MADPGFSGRGGGWIMILGTNFRGWVGMGGGIILCLDVFRSTPKFVFFISVYCVYILQKTMVCDFEWQLVQCMHRL